MDIMSEISPRSHVAYIFCVFVIDIFLKKNYAKIIFVTVQKSLIKLVFLKHENINEK